MNFVYFSKDCQKIQNSIDNLEEKIDKIEREIDDNPIGDFTEKWKERRNHLDDFYLLRKLLNSKLRCIFKYPS